MTDNQAPRTLFDITQDGVAWHIDGERDTWVLDYRKQDAEAHTSHCYRRHELRNIDARLPRILEVLSQEWSGRSTQLALRHTIASNAAQRQCVLFNKSTHYWSNWDFIHHRKKTHQIQVGLFLYLLVDHSIPGTLIAQPHMSYDQLWFDQADLEQQLPGICTALEIAAQLELSPQLTAQFCLASLGFPNKAYPVAGTNAGSVMLPVDLTI